MMPPGSEDSESLRVQVCRRARDTLAFRPASDAELDQFRRSLMGLGVYGLQFEQTLRACGIDPEAGSSYQESVLGVGIDMVWVPGGTLAMGSLQDEPGRQGDEGPVHLVELDGFWMSRTLVTQRQYELVLDANPSHYRAADNGVDHVTWDQAAGFCRRLFEVTNRKYCLPTEAQWEFASRAGSAAPWFCGSDPADLAGYCWFQANASGGPQPVAQRKPNSYGLYDMHGNLCQWCSDWYGADAYRVSLSRNPAGPLSGTERVLRGGDWSCDASGTRSAKRYHLALDAAPPGTLAAGFRICRPGFGAQ